MLISNALANGRLDALPALADELADTADEHLDTVTRVFDQLAYYGQLPVLAAAVRRAWPQVRDKGGYFDLHLPTYQRRKGESESPADDGWVNLYDLTVEFLGYLRREEGVSYAKGELARDQIERYILKRAPGPVFSAATRPPNATFVRSGTPVSSSVAPSASSQRTRACNASTRLSPMTGASSIRRI